MLADAETFPKTLPQGFLPIDGEPEFDPARHLQLEMPALVWSLQDLGYSDVQAAQYASPLAATSPVRMLSDEGIAALDYVLELLQPRIIEHGKEGLRRIYFGTYQSRFLRDLACSPDICAFLSGIYDTPIAPHTMAHLQTQVNFANRESGSDVSGWHHDQVGFTVVLTMHDAAKLKGGHFEYYAGPREEGLAIVRAGGTLPADKLVVPAHAAKGWASTMQGSAVLHRGQPMLEDGYRCNVINSYVSRDVAAPDPNRGYYVTSGDEADIDVIGDHANPSMTETARHAAWAARGRLGTIMEDLPFTEDRAHIIKALKGAIADVELLIKRLETPEIDPETYRRFYNEDDVRQMTTPRYTVG